MRCAELEDENLRPRTESSKSEICNALLKKRYVTTH